MTHLKCQQAKCEEDTLFFFVLNPHIHKRKYRLTNDIYTTFKWNYTAGLFLIQKGGNNKVAARFRKALFLIRALVQMSVDNSLGYSCTVSLSEPDVSQPLPAATA